MRGIRWGQSEEIFEMTIRDGNGGKLEEWKCMRKDAGRIIKVLNAKYGLGLKIQEEKNQEIDKDLDWIK